MKTSNPYFIFIVAFYVLGVLSPSYRLLFWGIISTFITFIIIYGLFIESRKKDVKIKKLFDSNENNVPPELKSKMDEIVEIMRSKGMLPENKKCDDPHCENCWGLGKD